MLADQLLLGEAGGLGYVPDGIRPPSAIPIVDVLALYSGDRVEKQARPKEARRRLETLLHHFGDKMLADINGNVCRSAGFGPDVIPHTTRHSGITLLAIGGIDPYEICRYASNTMATFEDFYAHHHPDFRKGGAQALRPAPKPALERSNRS